MTATVAHGVRQCQSDDHGLCNSVSSITDAGVPAYLKSLVNGADAEKAWAAMWKNGGVEIIANDQSNRTTPSYVVFTDTEP